MISQTLHTAIFYDFIKDIVRNIAWPVVVLTVALFYNKDIRKLVPRVTKAGPAGVEFEAINRQENVKSDVVADSAGIESRSYIPNASPVISEIENKLRSNLKEFKEENHIDLLIRELASARLLAAFEFILGIIFGSQIDGLRKLNQHGAVSASDAKEFFDVYYKQNPDFYTTGFEGWLAFLKGQELVRTEEDKIYITDLGREFLVFLARRNIPYAKPF